MNITTSIYYFSNFLEFYNNRVAPKLCEIDLFIKTTEGKMNISDVSSLLYISNNEINEIMILKKLSYIDSKNFFEIMEAGSSYICKLFYREKKCGSPYIYTRDQIAYIYELDINTVNIVCDKLNIKKLTNYSLPFLFKEISIDN